jgi:hypothetical protein
MGTVIKYTALDGTFHEISPNMDFQETWLHGSERPNGKLKCFPSLIIELLSQLEMKLLCQAFHQSKILKISESVYKNVQEFC